MFYASYNNSVSILNIQSENKKTQIIAVEIIQAWKQMDSFSCETKLL